MSAPQGAFYWNGVKALLHASYSLSLGVTPGVATMAIPPQPTGIAMEGVLLIRFGAVSIQFPDCRVIKFDFHQDQSGRKYWLLHIADGRWRWRYGIANAFHNRRLSNGLLDDDSKKQPRDLAKLLASAIGIQNMDVSALPNDALPFVDWEWKERPDTILAQLCESLGCRIAYNANGKVRVVKRGVGSALNKTNAIEHQIAIDPGEIPEKLVFVAGRSLWNQDLELEAVGEDVDGKIRLIEDLSYAPVGGWKISDPPRFACLLKGPNKKLQQLAQSSVFRWFRPKVPFFIGGRHVKELWQILPLNGFQLVPTDNFGFVAKFAPDNFITMPPWAYGDWLKQHDDNLPTTINVAGNLVDVQAGIMTGGFGIDQERGIIQFGQPMILNDPEGWRIPAKLKIRCAISYRDLKTRQCEHWTMEKAIPNGSKKCKPRYLVKEELAFRQGRDIATGKLNGPVWDNLKDLTSLATHYLKQLESEYQTQTPEVVTLPGFVPVTVDGAIQQVRWWVTEAGAPFTQVSRNTEMSPPGGSWFERRFFEDATREIFDGHRDARRPPI